MDEIIYLVVHKQYTMILISDNMPSYACKSMIIHSIEFIMI